MTFNVLTLTLRNFVSTFSAGSGRVAGAAGGLLASLALIDVVLIGFWWALDGGDRLSAIFKKLLYLGFWLWFTRNFASISRAFVDSLIQAGQMAGGGGGGVALLMDPSKIAGYGLDATKPIADKLGDLGITQISQGLVLALSYLAIIGCFLIMAIHVFLGVLEYYLLMAIVGVLIPFGLLPSTKFLAEKAIGAVVASGVKLMVLSFLMAVIEPVLATSMKFSSPDIPYNELFAMFLTACGLMLLTWKAPHVASGLLSGSPTLGAGDATAPAAGAAGVAAGLASGGASYLATRAAAGLTSLAGGGAKAASAGSAASTAALRGPSGSFAGGGAGAAAAAGPRFPSPAKDAAGASLVASSSGPPPAPAPAPRLELGAPA